MTTQTQYTKEHPDKNSTVSVRTYAKHGKNYYVSGEKVTADKKEFTFHRTKRHVR